MKNLFSLVAQGKAPTIEALLCPGWYAIHDFSPLVQVENSTRDLPFLPLKNLKQVRLRCADCHPPPFKALQPF